MKACTAKIRNEWEHIKKLPYAIMDGCTGQHSNEEGKDTVEKNQHIKGAIYLILEQGTHSKDKSKNSCNGDGDSGHHPGIYPGR